MARFLVVGTSYSGPVTGPFTVGGVTYDGVVTAAETTVTPNAGDRYDIDPSRTTDLTIGGDAGDVGVSILGDMSGAFVIGTDQAAGGSVQVTVADGAEAPGVGLDLGGNGGSGVTVGAGGALGDVTVTATGGPATHAIALGDGSTVGTLTVDNSAGATGLTVTGGTGVTTGAITSQNDAPTTITLGAQAHITGDVSIASAFDTSLVVGADSRIDGTIRAEAGTADGDRTITLGDNTVLTGSDGIFTGGGNDTVTLGNNVYFNPPTIPPAPGAPGNGTISLGAGDDTFFTRDVYYGQDLEIIGGDGADRIVVDSAPDYGPMGQSAVDAGWADTWSTGLTGEQDFQYFNHTWFRDFEKLYHVSQVPPPPVPCFAAGTRIATPQGEVPVEALRAGDVVLTQDHGPQVVRWAGARSLGAADLAAHPKLVPVTIAAGALGEGLPARDLTVSPQHRMLVRSAIAQRMFGAREVLVAAKALVGLAGIELAAPERVTYVHLLFDRHEIVLAEGAPSESLFTGPEALKAVGPAARDEILTLFPALRDTPAVLARDAARPVAQGAQARRLAERHGRNGKPLLG